MSDRKQNSNRLGIPKGLTLALILAGGAAAQPSSNAILGFETTAGWVPQGNASAGTAVSSTTNRTQGNFAYQITNAPNLLKLTSLPVASTATALSAIGSPGAIFNVDVLIPQPGNSSSPGSLQLFVNSPSTGLSMVQIGEVAFGAVRPGIYTTLQFPIPDGVRSALGGAAFNDLTFRFQLSSPAGTQGPYLFDNLRVHAVPLVTAPTSTPPGYGGSVDLVVFGGTPVTQSFTLEPVQVPKGFHLKLGAAASTSVELQLGLDGNPTFTCMYLPDSSDPALQSYIFASCTGSFEPGDLVTANWVQLAIVNGNPSQKIRAQLAENPVGDQTGAGIIPPMPTFWGNIEGCVLTPKTDPCISRNQNGVCVATLSTSCANEVALASQIATTYFNQANSPGVAPNWVVTPVPEFARPNDSGWFNLSGPPPPPGDPPILFVYSRHLGIDSNWDGYAELEGSLNTQTDPITTNSTTHLDAALIGGVVLWGNNVDILGIFATADTATGSASANIPPSSNATLHMYVFGLEIPGGFNTSPSASFDVHFGSPAQEFDLPPIQIWVFEITLGALAQAGVDINGGLSATGFSVTVTPQADLGGHVFGGVGVVVVSAGVDVQIDLIEVATPVTASAGWSLSLDPGVCAASLNFSLVGDANVGVLGGQVDLKVTVGICPVCWDDSWEIFGWPPLAKSTQQLFQSQANAQLFPLPQSLCTAPLNVSIASPQGSITSGFTVPLKGTAVSPNGGGAAPCSNMTWSLSPPPSQTGDVLIPASGTDPNCNVTVKFASPGGTVPFQRTITLNAFLNIPNSFGTITESSFAAEVLNITPLTSGPHILSTNPAEANAPPILDNQLVTLLSNNVPTPIQFTGGVVGASGSTTTVWTAVDSQANTFLLGNGLTVTWTPPAFGTFTIIMATNNSDGSVFGTATMQLNVQQQVR